MEEDSFQVRAYRKQDLAMLYFPDEEKNSASRKLRRWMAECNDLLKELAVINYRKCRKFYTRQEVAIIVEYLGFP